MYGIIAISLQQVIPKGEEKENPAGFLRRRSHPFPPFPPLPLPLQLQPRESTGIQIHRFLVDGGDPSSAHFLGLMLLKFFRQVIHI